MRKQTFKEVLDEHVVFTDRTFSKATAKGALRHARRELKELKKELRKRDPIRIAEEAADIIGCVIDAANRCGAPPWLVIQQFTHKLGVNKKRKWKYNGDGSYSHVKQ